MKSKILAMFLVFAVSIPSFAAYKTRTPAQPRYEQVEENPNAIVVMFERLWETVAEAAGTANYVMEKCTPDYKHSLRMEQRHQAQLSDAKERMSFMRDGSTCKVSDLALMGEMFEAHFNVMKCIASQETCTDFSAAHEKCGGNRHGDETSLKNSLSESCRVALEKAEQVGHDEQDEL